MKLSPDGESADYLPLVADPQVEASQGRWASMEPDERLKMLKLASNACWATDIAVGAVGVGAMVAEHSATPMWISFGIGLPLQVAYIAIDRHVKRLNS